jgi:hypothetical protein
MILIFVPSKYSKIFLFFYSFSPLLFPVHSFAPLFFLMLYSDIQAEIPVNNIYKCISYHTESTVHPLESII